MWKSVWEFNSTCYTHTRARTHTHTQTNALCCLMTYSPPLTWSSEVWSSSLLNSSLRRVLSPRATWACRYGNKKTQCRMVSKMTGDNQPFHQLLYQILRLDCFSTTDYITISWTQLLSINVTSITMIPIEVNGWYKLVWSNFGAEGNQILTCKVANLWGSKQQNACLSVMNTIYNQQKTNWTISVLLTKQQLISDIKPSQMESKECVNFTKCMHSCQESGEKVINCLSSCWKLHKTLTNKDVPFLGNPPYLTPTSEPFEMTTPTYCSSLSNQSQAKHRGERKKKAVSILSKGKVEREWNFFKGTSGMHYINKYCTQCGQVRWQNTLNGIQYM